MHVVYILERYLVSCSTTRLRRNRSIVLVAKIGIELMRELETVAKHSFNLFGYRY